MTDNPKEDPELGDPKTEGAGADPANRLEKAVEKEYRTLEDFDATQRQVIDEYVKSQKSAAVNGYVEKQKNSGAALTKADLDAALEQRDKEYAAKDEARSQLERTLIQKHGIAVGSPDYDKFAKAQANFKVDALRSDEGIAMIVKAAGLEKPEAGSLNADSPTGVQSLYAPKAFDGSPLEGMPPGGLSIKDLDAK